MNLLMLAVVAIIVLIVVIILFSCYKKCSTDQILVKYGLGGNKVFSGQGSVIIPFFQSYRYMTLTPQNLDIILDENSGVVSNDKIRLVIEADATFAISKNEAERKLASEKLLSLDTEKIKTLAKEILTGQLRSIVSEMTFEALLQDRKLLMRKVAESTEIELTKFGLDLMNFNIKRIIDLDGITDQLGKKASAIASSDAKIAIAEQTKFATVKVAEQEKEQEITIAKTEAEKAESISQSELLQQQAIEIKNSKVVELQAAENRKREVYLADSTKDISLKKIEAEKEVFLKDQEKEQIMLDTKKITAQKQADVRLEVQRAEEIVEAKVKREKEIIYQDAQLTMEKNKAENDLRIVQTKAEAMIKEAEAKAKAITLEAEALAKKEALPILEKAKAEQELLKVYSSDKLVQLKMLEILPELAKYQVEAVKNLKIDSLNVISGGEAGSVGAAGNEIGGTVNNIIKSIPAFKMANDIAKNINMPSLKIVGEEVIEKDENLSKKTKTVKKEN